MIDTYLRKYVQKPIDKVAVAANKRKINPNLVTVVALIIGLITAALYYFEFNIILIVALLWISGFLDVLDGSIARISSKQSAFGTIMDITFDRIVEGVMILAIVLRNPELAILAIILLITILTSMSIFLSFGACIVNDGVKSFKYQAGLAERTEGFIMISLILLFQSYQNVFMIIFIIIIFITIGQRFYEAYRYLK